MAKKECIDREAAYTFFKDQLEEETGAYSKGRNAGLRVAMSAVMNKDAIPAADVRPVVRATWVEEEKDGVLHECCSNCHEHIPKGRWGQPWHSSYCPNCGAEMKG